MCEIKTDIGNIKQYLPEIRRMAKGRALKAVNTPGVRTAINYELYQEIKDTLPVDSGALQDSPVSPSPVIHYRQNKYDMPVRNTYRYANGNITDEDIIFDPYEIGKDGEENHYASKIRGLHLHANVMHSTAKKKRAIAKILIEEMNDDR